MNTTIAPGCTGPDAREAARQAEQRSDFRVTLVMRTAKIVFDDLEALCLVRDASAFGVRLQFFYPMPDAQSYRLELDNGVRYPIHPVWTQGDFAGFRSEVEIDLKALTGGQGAGFASRQIRLQTSLNGTVHANGETAPIAFENISQQGAGITCPLHLAIDQVVRIETAILPSLFAKIRWRKRPHYGIVFEEVFQFTDLARMIFMI